MPVHDPYALEHLLAAGTVVLQLDSEVEEVAGISQHNDKDWKTLGDFLDVRSLQLARASQRTMREIEFLVSHDFLRATWRYATTQLRVRVYLVPFDLPGVSGCLWHRDEAKVLIPARKALFSLLSNTDRCETAWTCTAASSRIAEPFIPPSSDALTLSEIFGELPSPKVDASVFLSGTSPEIRRTYKDALHWDAPPGMQRLYPYQRRTVARMLQQELDPGMAVDPLYIPISGVCDTKVFYLQPSTLELLRDPPMRDQAKGGILCEEMGTGKTCIVLALIVATKHQMSAPEEVPLDAPDSSILTPLAFRHFPYPQFQRARAAAHLKNLPGMAPPTLVELLTHIICTSPERLGPPELYTRIGQQAHLWDPIMKNVPFYHVYENIPETLSPRRKETKRGPRKMYLTSATLVIVPRAIMAQWMSEINKHCEGGSLRVLKLDNWEKPTMVPLGQKLPPAWKPPAIPPADKLASNYDIVLMTHERFAAEKIRCNPSRLYSWKHCECKDPEGTRVPSCICPATLVSPLVQIRWKRLVVDEGHVTAAQSNLAMLARELSVERKWIVSGTPTRNLMGLSLGQQHDSDINQSEGVSDLQQDDDLSVEDLELTYPDDAEEGTPEDSRMDMNIQPCYSRRWTRVDRDDLNRLGDMVTKFVGVPQFAHGKNLFRKLVVAPLMDSSGPKYGAIQVVSQLMQQVMFRHQIRIVEQELPDALPLLKEKTVVLKFQPLAAKTYNVMQSVIAVNAVDSERKDQDYLFHQSNRSSLRDALENLTQTMFWGADGQLFDIDEAIKRSESALRVAIERGLPDSDVQLVRDSIRVQRDAANDGIWRDVMLHEDNAFVIHGLSLPLQDAWLKLRIPLSKDGVALLDADRLTKLREILTDSPLISEERLIEAGFSVAAKEEEDALRYEEYLRTRKRKRRIHEDDTPANAKLRKENFKAGSKEKLNEIDRELNAALNHKKSGATMMFSTGHVSATNAASRPCFGSLKIGNSLSSKVDYILRKVLKHAAGVKFLIFSALPMSLAYLADALRVVQVPFLKYTSGVDARIRQQEVVTFETSDKYRVLLMELKLGARGLNLVTASRIIFCEPVWQGDIESQAIKRAHRIGQKSDQIKVSTLVMQGTSEEFMVTRRHALKRKSDRLPAMEEDEGMRKFMQNPKFIEMENIEPHAFDAPGLDIPLVRRPAAQNPEPENVSTQDDGRDVEASRPRVRFTSLPGSDEADDPPTKKIKVRHKMVRFG